MNLTPTFRRFHLQRLADISGVSGLGRIAEGCIFSDGTAVVRWLSACASTNIYPNWDAVMQVHGHGGATRIVFDDPDPREEDAKALPVDTKPTFEEDLKVVVNAFKTAEPSKKKVAGSKKRH